MHSDAVHLQVRGMAIITLVVIIIIIRYYWLAIRHLGKEESSSVPGEGELVQVSRTNGDR